ncbi:hypothetical protein EZV62_018954 [Acer yangbiense]|uniref:SGNH hydrolase-type esterase domain-containing protein n=1 Tax=Acer yangbiense TaxID=1000413 RepID=A0A5C7H9P4_9ROSI|nr:hypothetical protein EZV62_018954 [Acer yangbiense]
MLTPAISYKLQPLFLHCPIYSKMLHLVLLMILSLSSRVYGKPEVPCYFIFGDSLYDNGNNNDLDTLAKANYPPYGVDFRGGPTGRFTNGRNTADIIAEHLGFDKYIPSFASARGREILEGVNYASGIRDETGQHLGVRISLNNQLQNHQTTISHIESMKGKDSAADLLNKCMYTVGMGSNNYINNYLSNSYNTSHMYTPEQYATVLIQQYSQQLKKLYAYGARKIALLGIGPLGCTPGNVALHGTNGSLCVNFINDAVELFNSKLISLVDELNKDLHDAKFIYVNIYGIGLIPTKAYRLVNSPPCCEVGANINTTFQCVRDGKSCKLFRVLHLFWDATHPSETANIVAGGRSYHALFPSDTYPIDIHHLVRL